MCAAIRNVSQIEVVLLTLGDPRQSSGGYLFHRRLADLAPHHDARLAFVSIPPLAFPLALLATPAALCRARGRRPDVLAIDSIAAAFVAPWLPAVRLPVVAMLHQPPGGIGHGSLRTRIQAALDRLAYSRMRLLLVASQSLADELRTPVPLRVIEPGRDVATRIEPVGDLRHGRLAAILCVATWLPNKGTAELLDAFATLPHEHATLHLVGETSTDRAYGARIRARLRRPDLSERVIVHGQLPPERVAGLYRGADIFALPSFRETYGTAWGEAMDAGLPIVAWRAGNLPRLATHEREALMVTPGDVEGLGAALRRLVDDESLRRALGANARRRAIQRPTWDDTAAAFFDALRSVTAQQDESPPRRRGPYE